MRPLSCSHAHTSSPCALKPQAAVDIFAASPRSVDLGFGIINVVTGVLGSVAAGLALDRLGELMHPLIKRGMRRSLAGAGC